MDIRATAIGLVCTALAAVLLNGCTTVPVTGRSQLMFYGEKSDIELGEESWKEIQKQEKRSSDAGYNQALNRIGPNLAKVAERPDYKWEFVVFDSKEPNAFCLPGGKVAVYFYILRTHHHKTLRRSLNLSIAIIGFPHVEPDIPSRSLQTFSIH